MQTLRAFADLLAAADSAGGLAPIAAALGCSSQPDPLDQHTRRALGLEAPAVDVGIASGSGSLRALVVVVDGSTTLRDWLPTVASRLARRTPHILWIVVATQPSTRQLAIAAWPGDRRPPRIAALLADRARLVDSDAETLRALAAVNTTQDLLAHARWTEILGREALSGRFYRTLERIVGIVSHSSAVGTDETRAGLALLNVSRLLFLCFLEAKGWLNSDVAFLEHAFEQCVAGGGRFHDRVLRPLFFGTLNTPSRQRAAAARQFGHIPFLNGGLFARTPAERRHRGLAFSDEAFGQLIYDLFGQYRFTAHEESVAWTEAAVDPEMLGRAFESLMTPPERRRTGAFFTPFALVDRVTSAGLEVALETCRLDELTVLDPACGSGAFLVHALERIAARRAQAAVHHSGNGTSPATISTIRRDVLTRSIFGVDVNPTAVWLCELRLWLSVVIESPETDPAAVHPLPNLDRNIRVGDALAGRAFGEAPLVAGGAGLRHLRHRYAIATGPRKDALGRQLDREERRRALLSLDDELARTRERRRDVLADRRARDLFGERIRPSREASAAALALRRTAALLRAKRRRIADGGALPFSFPVHFGDVASRGGFSLIIGNPPWIRSHHVAADRRAHLRREYRVARRAAWEPGAREAGAGRGFAAQVDIAAVFIERSTRLLSARGAFALLVPVKLWRSLAGGGVRRWIETETTLRRIEDHSYGSAGFDAAVYPSLVVAQRSLEPPAAPPCVAVAVDHAAGPAILWQSAASALPFDASAGAPWILLPPEARRAFDLLHDSSTALAESLLGRPRLGVKCGCNDAFIVELLDADDGVARIRGATHETFRIERSLLRPLLRGEGLQRWRPPACREHVIWTHDVGGNALRELPPLAARWFARWRRELVSRSDAKRRSRWWSLFRTEAARYDLPRVVWTDIGREPRAAVLDANDDGVPLNTCYAIRCRDMRDACAFAALLNGPLARSWLGALAEPARGGYHRYLGWTLAQLPIPKNWRRARSILAPLGMQALRGLPPGDADLFDASIEAYAIPREAVEALVLWATP